jgi:hypothetical protein
MSLCGQGILIFDEFYLFFLTREKHGVGFCQLFLFSMMSAARTPGTQPRRVRRNTINTDPQPRSITAKGGKIIANKTCKQLIITQKT